MKSLRESCDPDKKRVVRGATVHPAEGKTSGHIHVPGEGRIEVLPDDNGLRPAIDQGTQVKMVADNDDQIEALDDTYDPIILRQGVMQVCDEKTPHLGTS